MNYTLESFVDCAYTTINLKEETQNHPRLVRKKKNSESRVAETKHTLQERILIPLCASFFTALFYSVHPTTREHPCSL